MKTILALLVGLSVSPLEAQIRITGETKYKPHTLVRLRAVVANEKSALLWRIYPNKVSRASNPRGICEFAAEPGQYEVELLVISQVDGALTIDEARQTITIEGDTPKPPEPDKPNPGKPDPINALARIQFGNAGCTATVIGPRRPDGRWDLLTAAHCVSGVGATGTARLKDGRILRIKVVAYNKTSDVCWCVTEDVIESLPFANLAKENPPVGTKVWHAGYGVDRPTNREDGEVTGEEGSNGQIRFSLSVSSGDSGGGIFRSDTNEVISTVCCTSGMARKVSMWGGSTRVCQSQRPKSTNTDDDWNPIEIPLRKEDSSDEETFDWRPMPMPIRTEVNERLSVPAPKK